MTNKINPDNKCVNLYEEIKYNKNALKIMFDMQLELQIMYGKKRKTITPKSKNYNKKIKEAIYYFTCFLAEFYELMEKHDELCAAAKYNDIRLELEFELIDMWHFLMNVFLYLDISFNRNFEFFYENKILQLSLIIEEKIIKEAISDIVQIYGQLINSLPYKTWKTYKNIKINKKEMRYYGELMLFKFFSIAANLGISKEKFYSLYIIKNNENFKRQNKGY